MEITMKTGMSLDSVTEMSMDRFMSLYRAALRVEARDKADHAWAQMVAAQGKPDQMQKITQGWLKRAGSKAAKPVRGVKDFIRDVKGGF